MGNFTDMRVFYNDSLKGSENPYENERWHATTEREAGFRMTKVAIHDYILPYLKQGMRVLEVGAGPGTWTKELLLHLPEISVDIVDVSDEMLAQARKTLVESTQVRYLRADFAKFVPDTSYDLFFSSRAIEYMPDKSRVAAVVAQALKRGGFGCVITKYPHYLRARLMGKKVPKVHTTQISPTEFSRALEVNELRFVHIVPVTFVFPLARSGKLDLLLHTLLRKLPIWLVAPIVESYLVIFQKK